MDFQTNLKYICYTIFFIGFSTYAQHTERFKTLMSGLEKGNSTVDTTYYSNGQIKYLGKQTEYTFQDKEYLKENGISIFYHRNGTIGRISVKDAYGYYLNEKFYDKSGELTEEWITTEIDNDAKDLEEYFKRYELDTTDLGDIKRTINYYKLSKNTKERFLYKQVYIDLKGLIVKETITFFNEKGEIIKTKIIGPEKV